MFADFHILHRCSTTNARVSTFQLDRNTLSLPIFMPVATYGAMRGVKMSSLPEEIILNNTYHLRGLGRNTKHFTGWDRSILTDSGGFQIQSLPDVQVTDEGVLFGQKLFTPEESMDIQTVLGADIIMQLDDVVNPTMPRPSHERAIARSIQWLDRAIDRLGAIHAAGGAADDCPPDKRPRTAASQDIPEIRVHGNQLLFPIVQGGLLSDLRAESIRQILLRKPKGLAIGGLCGGENKDDFYSTVYNCCMLLPHALPRYIMGVGYPEDIVVCCALGTDMSDCVYPTRTARFGRALTDDGGLTISNALITQDIPIDRDCGCRVCRGWTRAFLATIRGTPNFPMLLSIHNLFYMRNLTARIRQAIQSDEYPDFIRRFMARRYGGAVPPPIVRALSMVGVVLDGSRASC